MRYMISRQRSGTSGASQTQNVDLANVRRSLADLLGSDFLDAVAGAAAVLTGEDQAELMALAASPVDFFPQEFADRADALLGSVGKQITQPVRSDCTGAPTEAYARAFKPHMAPINALGCVRVGQDGKGYLITKSEHYHASLGHRFPGLKLAALATRLGLDNVTHNNTRGYVTRTLERRLVAACNGMSADDTGALDQVLRSTESHVLNRVINLETGSLAVEAGLKMMLSRFYAVEEDQPEPEYAGRVPVFMVMGDQEGGISANYHGTTILTQLLRGLWPDLQNRMEKSGLYVVRPVGINDIDSFQEVVDSFDHGRYKVAGFFHEIVLMNYGGKLLSPEFLQEAYAVAHEHDIPVMVDEIQSCVWSPAYFLFREYGLRPDFVAMGKGFPAGNAPASRIVTTAAMDRLSQFGALVTNGQEEIASLYYLISMEFVQENGHAIRAIGDYYERRLREVASRFDRHTTGVEGLRHLCGIAFPDHDKAGRFVKLMNARGIDISAQSYKTQSLPIALTKLPLIATRATVDFVVDQVAECLAEM